MRRLAETLDAVRATRSRKEKTSLLSALLRGLSPDELPVAARLVLGQLLRADDRRTLGVGWALALAVAAEVTGRTEREVVAATREAGDFGDALATLLVPAEGRSLPLSEVAPAAEALAATADRAEKQRVLVSLFSRTSPSEARYLAKAVLGELRIGVQRSLLEDGLAAAFEVPLPELRAASALTPDIGDLADRARRRELASAALAVGTVAGFMLATPTESVKEPVDAGKTVVEDKLDGVRVQAHVSGGAVQLFARGQGEVTHQFPEVAERLAALPRPVILDGEVLAVTETGQSRPFQALQARLGRAAPDPALRARVRVAFVAFDVLFDGESLLAKPWAERRPRLEALGVQVNPVTALDAARDVAPQLDALFEAARARGNEGLMLKRVDAPYDAGRRGSAWRKVKRALATLDVVITRAERGHGKRAGVLSDYTFGVWKGDVLVEIGKAFSGLTDAEIAELTVRLEALTVRQVGHYRLIRPDIVLEVAFDGLQPSRRHDSGFALRFPRIARIRDDKKPADADRLEAVRALFDAQVKSGHREETPQLGLFDDDGSKPD